VDLYSASSRTHL